jgi:hypothetical protein
MNNISNWISVVFILSFLSCSEGAKENPFLEIEKSKNVFNLKGDKIYFPKIINPISINDNGDFLIISENRRNDPKYPLLHIIQKWPLELVSSKGKPGFGPFEIPDATLVESGPNDSTFTVYSSMSKTLTDFSLTDTSMLGFNQYKQPQELYGVYQMFHATDSTMLGVMANDPNRLVEFSLNDGKRLAGYGKWERIPDADHLIDYTDPIINYHLGQINK